MDEILSVVVAAAVVVQRRDFHDAYDDVAGHQQVFGLPSDLR